MRMSTINRILILLVISSSFSANASDIPLYLQGKSGAALAGAIYENCRPQHYVGGLYGNGGAWEAFRTTDADNNGKVIDRYSTKRRDFALDGVSPTPEMTTDCIVNQEWWKIDGSRAQGVELDLYNLIPCDAAVPSNKKNYPPGIVTKPSYQNGTWKSGIGTISEVEVNFYEPANEYKGDFARAIMYVALVYPCSLWSNLGENFFDDNTFPTLNAYSRRLLLEWHAADPVSDIERTRNNAIEAIQGNRNPFVDYPEIVDHIWGDKADESFEIPDEPHPLKASYSINEKSIDLVSPYVPEGAVWTIDGKTVEGKSVKPADLGIGTHELRFTSPLKRGKLKIRVTE